VKCHCYYVFLLRFVFTIVMSFSLHAMLPLLANKDEYTLAAHKAKKWAGRGPPGPIASAAYNVIPF